VLAWLERLSPKGHRIALPDGKATLVFGRSRRSTLVFDDPLVSPQHVELNHDGTFWRARDLGTRGGTRVNRSPISYPRALFHGDVLEFGATRLRFVAQRPADNESLREVIARDPDLEAPYLVYADWLLERGDPLGERILAAQRSDRLDHLPWLGPLWDPFVAGELELDFHLGFVRRAVVRTVAGRVARPDEWFDHVVTLLGSRIGCFLRALEIDVPSFAPRADQALPAVLAAQEALAALPALPRTLTRLWLGYQLRPGEPSTLKASAELAARIPALGDTDVFLFPGKARLRLLTLNEDQRVLGLEDGVRPLRDITRVRQTKKQLHLESPPGIPFITGGDPCFLAQEGGRWRLTAGRLKGAVRVNGRTDTSWLLLPQDVISVQGVGCFRFEVAA